MDKITVKQVLSAYRTAGQDGTDPLFVEALREVAADPELARWFEDEQRFDSLVRASLQDTPAPAGLKEMILLNAASPGSAPPPTPFAVTRSDPARWRWTESGKWLAAAACMIAAFVIGRQTHPRVALPGRGIKGTGVADGLGLQAIDYTSRMPALQFVCFSSKAVANWIDAKSDEMHMGKVIGKPLGTMQMIGSSAAQWDGKPVIMIALQNGNQMAMLYIVRSADFPEAAGVVGSTGGVMEKDGWVSKTGRNGDHLYVLTTKGTRDDLDFPMPL